FLYARKNKDILQKTKVLIKLGEFNFKQGQFFRSIHFYKKASKFALKINNAEVYSLLYRGIGINYRVQKKYNMALKYFKKELDKAETSSNRELIYKAEENLGISYNHQAKNRIALSYLNKALDIAYELKNNTYIANCY